MLLRHLEILAGQIIRLYCSVETTLVVGRVEPFAFLHLLSDSAIVAPVKIQDKTQQFVEGDLSASY